MISVIIPIMPIMPYSEQIITTLEGLERQTADIEVIVCEQPVEQFINKPKLQNEGFAKSKGDIIFHCDADIIFKDKTILERMEEKLKDFDVIYPMFYSVVYEGFKLADGLPFMRREVWEEYGDNDETAIGISLESFPFLHWAYFNKRFHCSKEFMIEINKKPFVRIVGKAHKPTQRRNKKIALEVIAELKGDGVWPDCGV
jgi:hypothetical protein